MLARENSASARVRAACPSGRPAPAPGKAGRCRPARAAASSAATSRPSCPSASTERLAAVSAATMGSPAAMASSKRHVRPLRRRRHQQIGGRQQFLDLVEDAGQPPPGRPAAAARFAAGRRRGRRRARPATAGRGATARRSAARPPAGGPAPGPASRPGHGHGQQGLVGQLQGRMGFGPQGAGGGLGLGRARRRQWPRRRGGRRCGGGDIRRPPVPAGRPGVGATRPAASMHARLIRRPQGASSCQRQSPLAARRARPAGPPARAAPRRAAPRRPPGEAARRRPGRSDRRGAAASGPATAGIAQRLPAALRRRARGGPRARLEREFRRPVRAASGR